MPRNRKGHGSDPRITPKARAFIDALFQHPASPVAEVAKIAGCSERAAYYMLRKSHVKTEIERRVRERLGTAAFVQAADRITKLIAAESEYVAADVAKHVLAINGVKPSAEAAPASGGIEIRIIYNGRVQQFDHGGNVIDAAPALPTPVAQPLSTRDRRILDAHEDAYDPQPVETTR